MTPVSRWPARLIILTVLLWPLLVLGTAFLLTAQHWQFNDAQGGMRVWSVFGNELPSLVYWLAFVPPAGLLFLRARGTPR
jgi:hypothetical protein